MKEYDFCHFFLINSPIFNNSLIDLLQHGDLNSRHLFVCLHKNNYDRISNKENSIYDPKIFKLDSLEKYLQISKYIVIHSLEYSRHDFSKIDDNISKRIIWSVWGHDLYIGMNDGKIKHFLRRIVNSPINPEYRRFKNKVKQFRAVFCGFQYDFVYVRKHFKNNNLYSPLYPSGYYLEDIQNHIELNKFNNNRIQVLLGHNASPFLNHIKNLKRLMVYGDNVDIHIPLSYGSSENANKIISFVKEHFDENSVHIYTDFMDSCKYINLLSKIDIAIFDNKYQAAFGNIILLLYLGKKIYLNKYGVMYKGLKLQNLNVFETNEIGKVKIDEFINKFDIDTNIQVGKNLLSREFIFNQWRTAFDDIIERDKLNE